MQEIKETSSFKKVVKQMKGQVVTLNVKFHNRLKDCVHFHIDSDRNAVQVMKTDISLSTSSVAVGGEVERKLPVASFFPIAGETAYEFKPPTEKIFVSAFIRKDDHFAVLFLNCRVDAGKQYEIIHSIFIDEVTDYYSMTRWVEPAAVGEQVPLVLTKDSTEAVPDLVQAIQSVSLEQAPGNLSELLTKQERIFEDGSKYYGDIKDDKKHGYGVLTYPNGDVYAGDWIADKRHGRGLFRCDGLLYDGDWKNDLENGHGVYKHSESDAFDDDSWEDMYEGAWLDGLQHGYGIDTWADIDGVPGEVYRGYYKKGKRHGYGLYIEPRENRMYDGYWRKDKRHGSGREYKLKLRLEGEWDEDTYLEEDSEEEDSDN